MKKKLAAFVVALGITFGTSLVAAPAADAATYYVCHKGPFTTGWVSYWAVASYYGPNGYWCEPVGGTIYH